MGLGSLDPGRVLARVEPSSKLGCAGEAIDHPVLAAGAGVRRPEYLDTEVPWEATRGSNDSLEEFLVGGFVAWLDAAGYRGGDGTSRVNRRRRLMVRGQFKPSLLNCSRPMLLRHGSLNQAASAKPTSATPSLVVSSGSSYSTISTPRLRSSATSAAMSSTRQHALVWVSWV